MKDRAICECGNDKYFIVYRIEELNRAPILFTSIPENAYRARMKFKVECLECGQVFDCIEVDEDVIRNAHTFSIYDVKRLKSDREYFQAIKELEFGEV